MKIKILSLIWLTFASVGLFVACEDDDEGARLEADFSVDAQEAVAGEEVTFSDQSTGSPSRWNWYFEGGTPSSSVLHSPSVTYGEPGTYDVKLVIGRSGDSTSITRDGYIVIGYPSVAADFTVSKTVAVEGETITFTDQSQGFPTEWFWEFTPTVGTAITSTEQHPAIAFANEGVYTVKLTATNPANADEEVKTDFVTIIDPNSVVAAFASDVKSTYTGAPVQFTDESEGLATAWSWTLEGGTPATSGEENPVVTYDTPGRYKVLLTVSNSEKSSDLAIEDYIVIVPGDGLVAYYPFDGNGNDSGPNAVHAAVVGGGISFDGTDRNASGATGVFTGSGVLEAPDHASFNHGTGDFSVSCWVKTGTTSRMMVWMESGATGSGDNQSWLRIGDNATDRRMRFAVEDNTGGAILNLATAVADDAWHHVVCVRSGTNRKVYVDGVQVGDNNHAGSARDVSGSQGQPFKIGAQATGAGTAYSNYYTGALDDLTVYSKALTLAEVEALFNL